MSLKNRQRGVTLLELLIAVVMIIAAVVMISMTFPKAAKSVTSNRQHWVASSFANSRVQDLKQQRYPLVLPTDAADFGADATCNCANLNMAAYARIDAQTVDSGVTYTRKICINLLDRDGAGNWVSNCPNPNDYQASDKGLKRVRIFVTWTSTSNTYKTETETMVSR
jgi:type II secretory pathway pseudopilin PulG